MADTATMDTCDGRPLQQAFRSTKNVALVTLLATAVVLTTLAHACGTSDELAVALAPRAGEPESVCTSVGRQVHPRHLAYVGYGILLLWCCCPCFKLECDTKEIEKRSCFLKAVQRRRRNAARRARAVRDGVPFNELPDSDDELEP